MDSKILKQRGFTLVETLVSIGILAIISTVVVTVIFIVTRTSTNTKILQEIKQNGETAIVVMTDFIRWAEAGECQGGNSIVVEAIDGETTTFSCATDGDTDRIASDSANPAFLTSSEDISCSEFTCLIDEDDRLIEFSFKLASADQIREFSGKAFLLNINN